MPSTQEENAALIREFLTTVVRGGDTDALGIFLSGDALDSQPVLDNRVDSERVGPTYWSALAAADLDITIDDIVAADEKVAVRGTITGIHRESLLDGIPTGGSVEFAIVWFCRIDNGQILETWSLPRGPWLVRQLDASLGRT